MTDRFESAPPTRSWVLPAVCLALALLAAGPFFQARHFGYINYDDADYVFNNPTVLKGLTWEGLAWAFGSHSANWHPLTWLSHMLDVTLFGPDPGAHHLVNLGFHVANTLLLFQALRALAREFWPAALVAALFAVHPTHVESVVWIAERKDVLSMFFAMLCLLGYAANVARPSRARAAWALGAFVLGIMSKPMVVTLPVLLLLLDYWPLGRMPDGRAFLLRCREKLPYFGLAAASSLVTIIAQRGGGAMISVNRLPPGVRVGNALTAYLGYLEKLVWPFHLGLFYPIRLGELRVWKSALFFVLLAGLTVLAVRLRRRWPHLAVGWLWFLVSLLPVIGLIQVGSQVMADRYTYLPYTGLFILLVWSARDLLRAGRVPVWVGAGAAGILLTLFAMRASTQTRHWRSSVTIWNHTLRVIPGNIVAESNLGDALYREGRYEEAIPHYQAAVLIKNDVQEATYGLGASLMAAGRKDEALQAFQWTLVNSPEDCESVRRITEILVEQGRLEASIPWFERLLELEPVRMKADATPGRQKAVSQGLRMRLGFILRELGREAEALPWFQRAHEADPRDVTAAYNFALSLAATGRRQEAREAFQRVLDLQPGRPEALKGLRSLQAAP